MLSCICVCVCISVCNHLYLYISLTLVWHYWYPQLKYITIWITLDSSSCLSVNPQFNSEKLGFYLLTFAYLIVQFHCTHTAVSELLTKALWETTLSSRIRCSGVVSFVFSLTGFTHFQSYLGEHLFPLPLVRVFHTFVVYLDSLGTVRLLSWNPLTSWMIFCLNLHPPSYIVCIACSLGFDRCMFCPPLRCCTERFHYLKCPVLHLLVSPPFLPDYWQPLICSLSL